MRKMFNRHGWHNFALPDLSEGEVVIATDVPPPGGSSGDMPGPIPHVTLNCLVPPCPGDETPPPPSPPDPKPINPNDTAVVINPPPLVSIFTPSASLTTAGVPSGAPSAGGGGGSSSTGNSKTAATTIINKQNMWWWLLAAAAVGIALYNTRNE